MDNHGSYLTSPRAQIVWYFAGSSVFFCGFLMKPQKKRNSGYYIEFAGEDNYSQ